MNLHKYDTLNQEMQVTPDYGYITNSKISQCQGQLPSQWQATIAKQVWDLVTKPPNMTSPRWKTSTRTHKMDWTQRSPQIQRIDSTHVSTYLQLPLHYNLSHNSPTHTH